MRCLATELRHHPQLRQHAASLEVQGNEPDGVEEEVAVQIPVHEDREDHAGDHERPHRKRVMLVLVGVTVRLVQAVQQVACEQQRAEVHQLVEPVPALVDRDVPVR